MDEYSIEERSAVINVQSNNTEIRRMDEDTAAEIVRNSSETILREAIDLYDRLHAAPYK